MSHLKYFNSIVLVTSCLLLFPLSPATASPMAKSREIGAITCVHTSGDVIDDCLEYKSAFECVKNETKRKLINRYIMAPVVCTKDPLLCEGGPFNDPLEVIEKVYGGELKVSYVYGLSIVFKKGTNVIRQDSVLHRDVVNSARVSNLDGVEESLVIQAQLGKKIYDITCHAFTATFEQIKKHDQKTLKNKLKAHFFKH